MRLSNSRFFNVFKVFKANLCDGNTSKVVTNHFYNMCLTGSEHGTTTRSILAAIENKFGLENIPSQNCVSLSVDNASTMSCPCHLAFGEALGLNVKHLCIDKHILLL